MDQFKGMLSSKTIWGGGAAVLAGAAGIFGYTITPVDQAQLIELASSAVSAVGGIVAIVGRIVATKKIATRK